MEFNAQPKQNHFAAVLLVLIALALMWTGYIVGSKRSVVEVTKDTDVISEPASRLGTSDVAQSIIDNLSSSPVSYGGNGSSVRLYDTDALGHPVSFYGSLFSVKSIDTRMELNFVPVNDEVVNALNDPAAEVPDLVIGMYSQNPTWIENEDYGSLLVTPTSTPTRLSWVSEVYDQPVLFLAEFPRSRSGGGVLHFDTEESQLRFSYNAQMEQALFNHVMEIYPPDHTRTQELQDMMLAL